MLWIHFFHVLLLLFFAHQVDISRMFCVLQTLLECKVTDGCQRAHHIAEPDNLLPQRNHLLLHLFNAAIKATVVQLGHLAPFLIGDVQRFNLSWLLGLEVLTECFIGR